MLKIGSLCTGYGGLDLAALHTIGGRMRWHSEIDPAASTVLERRFPGVPNIGNMTAVDWRNVEPVDVITGGTPCQDLSHAGRRLGMVTGTRSNLWVAMREAIAVLRPSVVIWENVRGAYTANADSAVESEPGLLGIGRGRPALRALGRVLGDLSDLGFDAEWVGLRAADVGAPHGRFRVFVIAYADGVRLREFGRLGAEESDPHGRDRPNGSRPATEPPAQSPDTANVRHERVDPARDRRTGSPDRDRSTRNPDEPGLEGWTVRSGESFARADGLESAPDTGGGRGDESDRPTRIRSAIADRGSDADERGARPREVEWGKYGPAVSRWERTLGRRAPNPTNPDGRGGAHRLAPEFVEWMMGLEPGWVTGLGLSRNQALHVLGNGVVPQQASRALEIAAATAGSGGHVRDVSPGYGGET